MEAHRQAMSENFEATDDAALVEKYGFKVMVAVGSYANLKVTSPEDLPLLEYFLKQNNRMKLDSATGKKERGGRSQRGRGRPRGRGGARGKSSGQDGSAPKDRGQARAADGSREGGQGKDRPQGQRRPRRRRPRGKRTRSKRS
jgi:hypothetical protein